MMGNEQVGDKFGRENFYHTPLYFLGFELWESIINLKIRLKKLKIASENRDIFVLVTEEKFVRGCKRGKAGNELSTQEIRGGKGKLKLKKVKGRKRTISLEINTIENKY